MGKVASLTVFDTLKSSGNIVKENDIYHLHWLNQDNIDRVKSSFISKNLAVPGHLEQSEWLAKEINFKHPRNLTIITSVRKMPSIYISGFFQNIRRYIHIHPDILNQDKSLNINKVVTIIRNNIHKMNKTGHYPEFWLQTEIEALLDIDLCSIPFNYEKKYTLIKHRGVNILILRLENMSNTLLEGLTELFGFDYTFTLVTRNVTSDKEFNTDYKRVSEIINNNEEILKLTNNSKYMKSFYRDYM